MTHLEFDELINKNIDEDVFSSRAVIWLKIAEKTRIVDLITMTESELYSVRNITKKGAEHTISKLKQLGLALRPEMMAEREWVEELREKMVQNDIKNHGENFNDLMKTAVEKLDLSVRSWAHLDRAGKKTIEDLIKMTNEELCQVRNINKSCVKEIISAIRAIGLDIRPDKFGEEEWIEYLKAEFKEQTETQEPKTTNKTNRKGLIAKLLEVWNEDVEKEVQDIIDRNI